MSLYNWITPGYDPTASVSCITRSQLLQEVQEARPAEFAFMGILSDTAPDVVTYPDAKKAIWAETAGGEKTGNFFWYDGSAWQPWKLQDGTLLGTLFANYTIDKIKLSLMGSSPNYVIAVNGAGNAWVWSSVIGLISDGTLVITKLTPATEGAGMVLYSGPGGVWGRTNLDTRIATVVADMNIDMNLVNDPAGEYLENQVPAAPATPGAVFNPKYVEDILRDNQIDKQKLKWQTITVASSSGIVLIDGSVAPSYFLYLTENVTDLQVSLHEGECVTLAIKQNAATPYTVAFNSAIKWPASTAPTMTATLSHVDVITLIMQNGVIRANAVQNFAL